MKKIISIVLVTIMIITLCGCDNSKEENVKILTPEGIPSIAMGGLFDIENYEFTTVSGASVLSTELMQDNYDVIVAPIILGAQLYLKNTMNYELASIITTGNSYLVFREEDAISSLKDLEGKTIASYGQNTAPDIMLKAALEISNVDISNVEIVYENSVADVLTNRFLAADGVDYILCAEPIISKIEISLNKKVGNIKKIDLQEVFKENNAISLIPQAGVFVNKKADSKSVEKFLNNLSENVKSLNENPTDYAEKLINLKNDSVSIFTNLGKEILVNAIPNSNIVYLKGIDNKTVLDKYFELINKYNEKILNKGTVDEKFYKE